MAGSRKRLEEGRTDRLVPSSGSQRGVTHGARRRFRGGVAIGLLGCLLVVLVLPGVTRPASRSTPVDGQRAPVEVVWFSFQLMGETFGRLLPPGVTPAAETQLNATLTTPSGLAQTMAVAQSVMSAAAMPEVRQALGLPDTDTPIATPATEQAHPGIPSSRGSACCATTPVAPNELRPTYPERMAPGDFTASVARVTNPSRDQLVTQVIQAVVQGESSLCSGMRVVVVSVEVGKAPQMMKFGSLQEMQGPARDMVLEPGKSYDIAFLVSAPSNLPDEYQGLICTVNFWLESQKV